MTGSGSYLAGAGAGNPGGIVCKKGILQIENVKNSNANGTGGLLIIYCNNIINNGTVESKGIGGQAGSPAYGGSSGGGSINIFYKNNYTSNDNIYANGGSNGNGGAGGTGSISVGIINEEGTYVSNYKNY